MPEQGQKGLGRREKGRVEAPGTFKKVPPSPPGTKQLCPGEDKELGRYRV